MDFKGYFTTGDGKRCDPIRSPSLTRIAAI
jgi:hypothetical protein